MTNRKEVEAKSEEFRIHTAHVERDYVFGWLLAGIDALSPLKDLLILRASNCFLEPHSAGKPVSVSLVNHKRLIRFLSEISRKLKLSYL